MSPSKYLMINLGALVMSFIIGALAFYYVDELRYIKFQLGYSLLFSFISYVIFILLKLNKTKNKDTKAIGLSMMQSLFKLILSLAVLIPIYQMYCPITNVYLLNFIMTYLIFMVLDSYILSKE